jgi:predicted GTPase
MEEEEKKVFELKIKGNSQEICDNVLNVLLFGTSGSGKSSLINYLAGEYLAPVGNSGSSCTMNNKSYQVTIQN